MVGVVERSTVGNVVGNDDGRNDGETVGSSVNLFEGIDEGNTLGVKVCCDEGVIDGLLVGTSLGSLDSLGDLSVGFIVGCFDGNGENIALGKIVGLIVGRSVKILFSYK